MITALLVYIPVPIPNGWAWGRASVRFPATQERISDLAELPRVVRTYGRAVALTLREKEARQFNVTAYDSMTGAVLGRDQWLWCSDTWCFQPHGIPWVPLLPDDTQRRTRPAEARHAPVYDLTSRLAVRPLARPAA